jgi:hypothetical protein
LAKTLHSSYQILCNHFSLPFLVSKCPKILPFNPFEDLKTDFTWNGVRSAGEKEGWVKNEMFQANEIQNPNPISILSSNSKFKDRSE